MGSRKSRFICTSNIFLWSLLDVNSKSKSFRIRTPKGGADRNYSGSSCWNQAIFSPIFGWCVYSWRRYGVNAVRKPSGLESVFCNELRMEYPGKKSYEKNVSRGTTGFSCWQVGFLVVLVLMCSINLNEILSYFVNNKFLAFRQLRLWLMSFLLQEHCFIWQMWFAQYLKLIISPADLLELNQLFADRFAYFTWS